MKPKPLFFAFAALALLAPGLRAQSDAPDKGGRKHDDDLTEISVTDKLLGIETALSAKLKMTSDKQWAKYYEGLFQQFERNGQIAALPGAGANETVDALTLGVKASDAIFALKAHDVEGLNQAAEQIEQLALKLGGTRKELAMSDTVRRYANAGRWLDSFMALGFLQHSIISYLNDNPEMKPKSVLVIVGGWLQGGRCVTSVIAENYSPEASGVLREPRLVDSIKKNMDALPAPFKDDPLVVKINGLLPEIKKRINVDLRAAVKEEDVKWLHQTFDDLVVQIAPNGAGAEKLGKP